MKDYLLQLNESQRKAVIQINGPVMIIAGPGSGKTRVLTFRVAHMISEGIDPFRILCLTFTNKAATEMRQRIAQLHHNDARNLWMGTFHSIFAKILRIEGHRLGYSSNFTIYDTADSKSLIKKLVKDLIPTSKQKLYKESIVYNRISSAKNKLITPEDYEQNIDMLNEDISNHREKFGFLYAAYSQQCFHNGAMDFDDLLLKTYQLLQRCPDVAYKYQNKFKYIMIDEFQDTNHAQYEIIKILAAVHENLCVVGDDAQSIYAFRGATIANILDFAKKYDDLQIYKLEQNYRSTYHIVNTANEIIKQNKNQLVKTIFTERGEGNPIIELIATTDNDEGRIIADKVFELKMRHQLSNKNFAVLYRTNAQSRAFEEAMRRLNIAYKIYGGLSFYQRKEIKDMVAYLRCIVNPLDEVALLRIINYPPRGIGDATINKLLVKSREQNKSMWEIMQQASLNGFSKRTAEDIETFSYLLKSCQIMLAEKNAFAMAEYIAKHSGIMKELYNDKSVEGVSRYENLIELLNSIKEFTESDVAIDADGVLPDDKSLGSYLQQISLLTDTDNIDPNTLDTVSLMTIHAAKGLEFPVVFVVGMEENLFPSIMSISSLEELEEERRLFYVAITRAQDHLFISHATTRYKFGKLEYSEPSRFIAEIPNGNFKRMKSDRQANLGDRHFTTIPSRSNNIFTRNINNRPKPSPAPLANFKADDTTRLEVGMKILHIKFGVGKVSAMDGVGDNRIAVIQFENEGEKKLMLKFAKLKII